MRTVCVRVCVWPWLICSVAHTYGLSFQSPEGLIPHRDPEFKGGDDCCFKYVSLYTEEGNVPRSHNSDGITLHPPWRWFIFWTSHQSLRWVETHVVTSEWLWHQISKNNQCLSGADYIFASECAKCSHTEGFKCWLQLNKCTRKLWGAVQSSFKHPNPLNSYTAQQVVSPCGVLQLYPPQAYTVEIDVNKSCQGINLPENSWM